MLPETFACEARALLFELHPRCLRLSRGSLAQSVTMRFFAESLLMNEVSICNSFSSESE